MSVLSKISSLMVEADKPVKVDLLNPITGGPLLDKDGKSAYLEVLSNDSEVARTHERKVADRRFANRNRKIVSSELEADTIELLVKLVRGWYLVSPQGEALDVPFSEAAAREIFSTAGARWILEAASSAVATREHFLPTTPKS